MDPSMFARQVVHNRIPNPRDLFYYCDEHNVRVFSKDDYLVSATSLLHDSTTRPNPGSLLFERIGMHQHILLYIPGPGQTPESSILSDTARWQQSLDRVCGGSIVMVPVYWGALNFAKGLESNLNSGFEANRVASWEGDVVQHAQGWMDMCRIGESNTISKSIQNIENATTSMAAVAYAKQRQMADVSGPALATLLLQIHEAQNYQSMVLQPRISILAHSTGARVLLHALRICQVSQRSPSIHRVMLVAADLPCDIFERRDGDIISSIADRVVVYAARNDWFFAHVGVDQRDTPNRLGTRGIRRPKYRPPNVQFVDCQSVHNKAGTFLGHAYHMQTDCFQDITASIMQLHEETNGEHDPNMDQNAASMRPIQAIQNTIPSHERNLKKWPETSPNHSLHARTQLRHAQDHERQLDPYQDTDLFNGWSNPFAFPR
eukprot:TRINITY_DN2944_c0_g8_i1.p1 TRINITY_DN2944_c0_g8~~TRINITY_DN2944_c0_g8_i1.p1  ORF type:complete len:433 (-),score=78.95 TRINITY_DN2944_c0_g8_i1:179-1477(-)